MNTNDNDTYANTTVGATGDHQDGENALTFKPLDFSALEGLRPYYLKRSFRACDSCEMEQYLYRYFFSIKYSIQGDALLMTCFDQDHGHYGILPFSTEDDLPRYFKLQERYFNEVLAAPHVISFADEEGVTALKKSDALKNYIVEEAVDARDYLYSGDDLRNLTGRKYSKKRNHINKFLSSYEGLWEYRKLGIEDRGEILKFLNRWMRVKLSLGEEAGVNEFNEKFDAETELAAEYRGITDLINEDVVFKYFRIGGIFIDGKLEAFSMGDYNPLEKMAVISVEKANEDITGLYQMINQQFLKNEFPEAELVNREDDVGLEGLRQSKLSYYPIDYARKFTLRQSDFEAKK